MSLRATGLGATPNPGEAYSRIWQGQAAADPGQDASTAVSFAGADGANDGEPSAHLQLAGFSPLDDMARAGAKAYFDTNREAKRNVRINLRGVVGPGFTDSEMDQVADGFLGQASLKDIGVLTGVTASTPQVISPTQKATIDGIIARLPNTTLNQRAIASYRRALANGSLRVR